MCNHWPPVDYSLVKNYKFVSIKASKKNELALTSTYQASEETSSSLLLHNRHNYPWNALTNPALLMCLHKIQLLQKKMHILYHPTNTHWAIAICQSNIFCLKFHVHCDLLMASQSGVGGCLLRPCWVLLFLCWLVALIPATKSSQIKTSSKRKKCHTGMVIVAAMAPAHAPSAKCSGVLQNKIMLMV
jgi:hypothetical protein